ncbi:YciI family protein [Arthrobacter sp. zg-Y1116]|uniref:YciI family protein n=1 Tax=Arthrobacter sp. zg-Y1116 TaxID=2964611 RepID=UPI002106A750|nr:hypothetical protein [Arthrobacter sp. zg-Y1116]MCQ1948148.1 hypothetical protein [Arthrobacter sp. zg-Y1116]
MDTEFDSFLTELQESGELLGGEALGDPAGAQLVRWEEGPVISSGPYAAPGEHLAGMFFIQAGTPQRAEEILARFASPGETVELRPIANM